jgi:hypothetical protein
MFLTLQGQEILFFGVTCVTILCLQRHCQQHSGSEEYETVIRNTLLKVSDDQECRVAACSVRGSVGPMCHMDNLIYVILVVYFILNYSVLCW